MKVRVKSDHTHVIDVDRVSADSLIARGDWEAVPEEKPEEKEVTPDGGSNTSGRGRTTRKAANS